MLSARQKITQQAAKFSHEFATFIKYNNASQLAKKCITGGTTISAVGFGAIGFREGYLAVRDKKNLAYLDIPKSSVAGTLGAVIYGVPGAIAGAFWGSVVGGGVYLTHKSLSMLPPSLKSSTLTAIKEAPLPVKYAAVAAGSCITGVAAMGLFRNKNSKKESAQKDAQKSSIRHDDQPRQHGLSPE